MSFTVTYRDASGASATEVVEATSRADCFAQMKARGIVPMSVKEGGRVVARPSRNSAHGRNGGKKSIPYVLYIALILLAGGVLGVWWWFSSGSATPLPTDNEPKKPSALAKEVKPTIPKPTAATNATKEVAVVAPTNTAVEVKPDGPPPGYIRLPTGRDIRCKLPPPGETKQMLIFGEMYEIDSEGNAKCLSPPPVFDNRFENSVLALSSEGGGLMPGAAKMIPKDEVVKYLFKNIEIKDDDPEDVIAKKIATAEMKELLKEHLKSGGTWEDFAEKATAFRQTERALESDARMTMAKMLREGDVEGVKMYRDKVNEFLKSKGYRGLKLPKKWLEALGEQKNDF